MEAVRCTNCGDTRWSLRGFGSRGVAPCEICGGEMVRERRRPERGPARPARERRDMARLGPPPAIRPSA